MKQLVNFRATEDEVADYRARAGAQGMSLSDWIRFKLEPAQSLSGGACVPVETPLPALAPFTAAVMQADVPSRVFESERPRAKRSSLCEHRRRPDEFCPRCD